jgi:hypothetical protein
MRTFGSTYTLRAAEIVGIRSVIIIVLSVLVAFSAEGTAQAACGTGLREMATQVSDINLAPGFSSYFPIAFFTVDLPNGPIDCDLRAITTVPGLSITSAYYYLPPVTLAPGTWTPIGGASAFQPGTQPWFGGLGGLIRFTVFFDGSAAEGTTGTIDIAVNEGNADAGEFTPRNIGAINVYVRSAPQPTWFTVTATTSSISGNRLILDHPYLNGNSAAKLFVSHVISAVVVGTTVNNTGTNTSAAFADLSVARYWNHPIAVAYDSNLAKWTIYNADGATMPVGITFSVRTDPSAFKLRSGLKSPVVATKAGVTGSLNELPAPFVPIDEPSATSNPYATIMVTMAGGESNPHPIAVQYLAPYWRIVNSDGTLIPAGVLFNVKVIGFSAYQTACPNDYRPLDSFSSNSAGISVRSLESASNGRNLCFWWQAGRSNLPIIVTPNLNPMNRGTTVNDPHYVGLVFTGTTWRVAHEDNTTLPSEASFNVWGKNQSLIQ